MLNLPLLKESKAPAQLKPVQITLKFLKPFLSLEVKRMRVLFPLHPLMDDSASKSKSQMSEEDGGQSQKQKKKKTKTYTHLTIAQQEAMVDWLKTHEFLYNKKLEGY